MFRASFVVGCDGAHSVPVLENVIETTDLLTRVLGTPNKLAQALRDTVLPVVSRLGPFQHAFVQRLSELGVAYPGSPIVEGSGKRYFDDSMRGARGIRSRFLIMVDDDMTGHRHGAAALASLRPVLERQTHRSS